MTASRPYVVAVTEENNGHMELDRAVIYSKEYKPDSNDKTFVYCNAWEAGSL